MCRFLSCYVCKLTLQPPTQLHQTHPHLFPFYFSGTILMALAQKSHLIGWLFFQPEIQEQLQTYLNQNHWSETRIENQSMYKGNHNAKRVRHATAVDQTQDSSDT